MEVEPEIIQRCKFSKIIVTCAMKLTEFGSARALILGFISNGTPSRPVNKTHLVKPGLWKKVDCILNVN
jgi:hypothetical protein